MMSLISDAVNVLSAILAVVGGFDVAGVGKFYWWWWLLLRVLEEDIERGRGVSFCTMEAME